MGFTFTKATKTKSKARFSIIGPSGSGKTWTALLFASRIASLTGGRVAVIDSERGSARKYADVYNFDVLELEDFSPASYISAVRAADEAGYAAIVVDSLSHAWMGKGGALEMVDRASASSRSGNSFDAWRKVTPEHNKLVDALLASRAHVFVTMRTKTEYIIEENDRGKKVPRKVGLQPVQRDGLEYEFDVVADMDLDNTMTIGKTRCPALRGGMYQRPDTSVADIYARWLDEGALPVKESAPTAVADAAPTSVHVESDAPEDFVLSIADASSVQELLDIGRRIAKSKPDSATQAHLKSAWESRKATLAKESA